MSGILDRNYKFVWLGAMTGMCYLILEKSQGKRFINHTKLAQNQQQNTNNRKMTIIYRRPFCPIGTVFDTDLDNIVKDGFWDNLPTTLKNDKYVRNARNAWVLMTPFGSHQIITTNPSGDILTGYYSRIFGIPVFPFSRLNK